MGLVLDLLTHAPDIALAPGFTERKFGLGLYDTAPLAAFAIEMVYGLACWRIYRGSLGLLAVVVIGNFANLTLFSSELPGTETLLSGRPMLVVGFVLVQIAVTLALVGTLSRSHTSKRSARTGRVVTPSNRLSRLFGAR